MAWTAGTVGNNVIGMKKAGNGRWLLEVRGDDAAVDAVRAEVAAKSAGQDVGVTLLQQKNDAGSSLG